ncbi:MAG: peptidyl-prolyl cis-trans isomerase [Gammaproteobacteria bacterium]|nr:peptidyl-prolyl cis-trans isomerase [Gammaproteobacteria bacterium]
MRKLLMIIAYVCLNCAYAQAAEPSSNLPQVVFHTNKGDIRIELFAEQAPVSVKNFLQYVDDGFYKDTVFHRVIPGFVIQGGGFNTQYQQKPTRAPIVNEADNGLKNNRGTLSMARSGNPHSATSQFFISLQDNAALDYTAKNSQGWGYAVFGRVVSGLEVVDAIAAIPTTNINAMMRDVPSEAIVVTHAERVSDTTKKKNTKAAPTTTAPVEKNIPTQIP